MPPSIINRQYQTVTNPDDAFDENGIIRDGYRVRIPLQMMDSRPAPRSAPIVIETGLRGTRYDLNREFYWDGSPKRPRRKSRPNYDDPDADDDEVIEELDADGRLHRYTARGPMGRTESTYREEDHALRDRQPGYRSHHVTAADRARVNDAYNEMVSDLQTAWMTPERKAQHIADTRRMVADAARGIDARDAAYAEMCNDLVNQWRPKDSGDYRPAAEGAQAPRGIWPLGAVPKHINANIKAGDPCFQNGASGTYVDGGDGFLYCRVDPMPTTRADAVPRTMTVDQAQAIRDQAYQEYCQYISSAWKT
jgi:hypothetical protein